MEIIFWVNCNDLIAASLEWGVGLGNYPKMALFIRNSGWWTNMDNWVHNMAIGQNMAELT